LEFVYLGYWIEESPKMNYKQRFSPCEVLWNGLWQPHEVLRPQKGQDN
jgi:arginine-tRNA-protein transferase